MKKYLIKIVPVFAVFLSISCDNYLDINQNPNNILYEDLYPNEVLAAALSNTYRTQSMSMNQFGNILTNAWSGNSNFYGAGVFSNPEYTLNFNSTFLNSTWDNLYLNGGNFQKIIEAENPNHKWDNYVAVAKIMKAHYMQYIVDLYGNAPYSEAFKGALNVTPKYDDDQAIYRDLISGLEEAWTMLDNPNANAEALNTQDIVFAGDLDKWKRFAATIELRLLLRMSNCTGNLAAYRDAHLNGFLSGKDFVNNRVSINPGYNSSSQAQFNPWYLNFVATSPTKLGPSGHAYKCLYTDWDTTTSAGTVINGSGGVNYPMVADPRRTRLFRNGSGATAVYAVTQGATTVDVYNVANINATNKTLAVLGLGLQNPYNAFGAGAATAAADGYIMTLQESELLQAEAHLRGYLGGNVTTALSHFNAAIDASFAYLNAGSSTSYKSNIALKPYFGLSASNTFDQNLCAIMYQKWVGLMGIHGMESYIEYTRTGFPYTPLANITTRPRKPLRLIYPASEYSNNSANVPSITSDDVFTVNSFSPFWLQGDPALGN